MQKSIGEEKFLTFNLPELVSWSLKSFFSTNMAISEKKGQEWGAIPTQ